MVQIPPRVIPNMNTAARAAITGTLRLTPVTATPTAIIATEVSQHVPKPRIRRSRPAVRAAATAPTPLTAMT